MRTRRRIAMLASLMVAMGALAAAAGAEVVQSGDLRVNFAASVSPTALPRERLAPITVSVSGKISTADGTLPPALDTLQIALNSAGRIDSHGLPVCPPGALQSTNSEAALERCRSALVGSGHFEALLHLTTKPAQVTGRALVFNSTVGGREGMLIHIFVAQPVNATLVIPLKISRGEGEFATVLTTRVPKLAGGSGSITELRLKIGRRFDVKGVRHSYLSAACPAPEGFAGGPFTLARGTFRFVGGRTLHANLVRNCEVRGAGGSG